MAYEDYDFESDLLPPSFTMAQLKAHDERMREGREAWSLTKSLYLTRYWDHIQGSEVITETAKLSNVNVEVNRLWGVITSYLGALYPRANRAVLGPDPAGAGDADKAQLAVNRWLSSRKIHHRVMSGLRQAILYPGCAAKIGYHPGHGSPLDRTFMRIIPWWEVILDSDVSDSEDERFRGHVYYRPLKEVEREYGLEDLSGTGRLDFLDSIGVEPGSGSHSTLYGDNPQGQSNFVRVLEICNLKDAIEDKDDPSIKYKGRLEIYVLDQGEISKTPVWMGPMPFASTDGTPLPHIVPLIFNHEPAFPLRGVAHARRIIPQLVELNAYRSFMAMATRKDTRQYITRKGTFNSDEMTGLTEGHDGLILQVEQEFDRPLDDAIRPINVAPISANISKYLQSVELDLERGIGSSPQARGIVTKATAFEVNTVQQYTESDFGMHAAIKDEWLAMVLQLVLRALISGMQDRGDSAGAYEEQDVDLAEVGAIADEDPDVGEENIEQAAEQEEDARVAEESGGLSPFIEDEGLDEIGALEIDEEITEIVVQELTLRDRRDIIQVSVEDLDADFEITFVEGGRTPLTDTAMQQNLIGLIQPYSQLWEAVQAGGPMSVMAKAYMQAISERFELPRDLHPDELDLALESLEEEAGEAAEEGGPPAEGEAPEEAVTPEQAEAEGAEMAQNTLAELSQLPPDQAIAALREIYADDPEMQAMLEQMAGLPPEQQAQMMQTILAGPQQPPGVPGAPV